MDVVFLKKLHSILIAHAKYVKPGFYMTKETQLDINHIKSKKENKQTEVRILLQYIIY